MNNQKYPLSGSSLFSVEYQAILMSCCRLVSQSQRIFLLFAHRYLLFKSFDSEKHQSLISANHFWQELKGGGRNRAPFVADHIDK